jgi:hypothetical protein
MSTIPFPLSKSQKSNLDRMYPPSPKSALIGKRAVELVKLFFQRDHPGCRFEAVEPGADLRAVWKGGEESLEVKGTDSQKISWNKLKVSSKLSYMLLRNGLPLYRITSVFSDCPSIHILRYGIDFTLRPEARWNVKSNNSDRRSVKGK